MSSRGLMAFLEEFRYKMFNLPICTEYFCFKALLEAVALNGQNMLLKGH